MAPPRSEVGLTKMGSIVVGKFVDRERPDYMELMHNQMQESLGGRYVDTLHIEEMEECECQS